MKKILLFVSALTITVAIGNAQSASIYETSRIMVFGDANTQVEADAITCWLNIYDNTASYDYSVPYDAKKAKQQQITIIDNLGCKDQMTNPTYASLRSYTGAGPYELKFKSKAEYEAVLARVWSSSSEMISVTMDIANTSISAEKRKQLTDQMLDKALADAKSKGERIAKSLGIIIGTPLYVEEMSTAPYTDYGYGGEYENYNVSMMVNVSARVQIQYEIKK